jgi:hypothetical protein
MRFFEIASGLPVPVSEEEQQLLDLITEHQKIPGTALDERQLELARLMVSRGLLNRLIESNCVYYCANGLLDLWRF